MIPSLDPGIYFGLPEDTYHALPYLSASGVKNLLVSPMDFWARSWMNPEREDEDTEAKTLGRAYHKRILEGSAAFYASYAAKFSCDDPNAIRTADQIKDALRALGEPVSFKTKDEGISRLLAADPLAVIYDDLKAAYEDEHDGKVFLGADMIHKIELSARMIECHPALKFYFRGGFPEVTVIWDDDDFGLRFKARFDYLKVNTVNDLKTFANLMNKSIERAVYGEIASRRYHIQAGLYLRAAEIAKQMAASGMVEWCGDKAAMPDYFTKWLEAFSSAPSHDFAFAFQQKGPAPVSVGAVFGHDDPMLAAGIACVYQAADTFKKCAEVYGMDGTPWVDTREPIVLHWQQFPSYANDF